MDADSTPLKLAIRAAGSEEKLAALIGLSQPAVNKAKRKGRASATMAIAIDRAGIGVTKEQLRPDLFPPKEPAQ